MIDDNPVKQQWFIEILKVANEQAELRGLGVTLHPAFGEDKESAVTNALDPAKLWEALHDSDAIYLVDLQLPVETKSLHRIFHNSDEDLAQRSLSLHIELLGTRSKEVISKHDVASLILCYCKLSNKPTLFVSTDAVGFEAREMVRCGLASGVGTDFPVYSRENRENSNFENAIIKEWSERILGLLDPWTRIADLTRTWFTKNLGAEWKAFEEDGLPHDMGTWDNSLIHKHQESVKTVFDWCPDSWWESKAAARALHECLKTVVGAHSQWMGQAKDKPLSLGGAYLIFLVAVGQKAPQYVRQFCVEDWRCFCSPNMVPVPFLASQDQESARRSLKCLYEFFLQIILLKDGQTLGLKELKGPFQGHPYFSVKLGWSDDELSNVAGKVRGAVSVSLDPQQNQHLFASSNTVGALLRFIFASKVGVHGFGAFGTIRLDDDPNRADEKRGWLRIGQYEAIQ